MVKIREFKIENIGKQTDFKKGGVIKCLDDQGKGKIIVKLDGDCNYVMDNRKEFKLNIFEFSRLSQKISLLKGYIIEDNK